METTIIKKFCDTGDTRLLKNLSTATQKYLIDNAYTCLVQKYGNQTLSIILLEHYKEIMTVGEYIVYKGNTKKLSPYESLRRAGVVIIPVITPDELGDIKDEFIDTLRDFPEYVRNPTNPDQDITGNPLVYSLGGFAALGNPASFHNILVRRLRTICRTATIPLFQDIIDGIVRPGTVKFEMLIDRMMYRYKSQSPSPESWHRDVIPKSRINADDEVYGGWLNIDTTDQYFSCIPGSHLGVKLSELTEGFAAVPKDQIDTVSKHRYKFTIPPGHMIIFPQYILHEVVATKAKTNMMRLFTGWRTTTSDNFIHPDMLKRMATQSIVPLPSGQLPPMYASNHGSFYLNKQFKPIPHRDHKVNLKEWSRDSMQPQTLVQKDGKDGVYTIVARYLKSLKDYGFKMYPNYTQEEIALYRPSIITKAPPILWTEVYKRVAKDDGPQKHEVSINSLTTVIIPKGIDLLHVEQDQEYPGGGNWPVNPYSFFVAGDVPYWNLSPNHVDYMYTTKKKLVMVYIKDYVVFHDWLKANIDPKLFSEIPFNDDDDPTWPGANPGVTYAWDYVEMGLLCSLFGVDGMIRSDEIVICGPFQDKLIFKNKSKHGTVHKKPYEGPTIYYTPSENILKRLRDTPSIKRLLLTL